MRIVSIFLFLYATLVALRAESIAPISDTLKVRMLRSGTWHAGCPVPLSDLRYLRILYRGFDGRRHLGEMIVNRRVAKEVAQIFAELYRIGYPIRSMRLVSDFGGSDFRSIEADNTSAFNCRGVSTGRKRWSKHAYGLAIDLNPVENPFVFADGHTAHRASRPFLKRRRRDNTPASRAMLLRHDAAVKLFRRYGWKWGGDFRPYKDYQHFAK